MREDKVEVYIHISASTHESSSWTRTISNTNMFMALVNLLAIFLLNALFKDLFQAIVQVFTRKYRLA